MTIFLPKPVAITPLNFYIWNMMLSNTSYDDSLWLLQGLRFGFDIGLKNPSLKSASRNCLSAFKQPQIIDKYIQDEIDFGTMLGPLDVFSNPDFHINRFGIIPKSSPGKFRLITDLSFPHGSSINDFIPDSQAEVTYAGIPEAINLIMRLGKGALIAKFDIRRAYRLLPVKSQQCHLLGMQWRGKFYVDLALPFGLRSAPKIFTRFADSLQFLFEKEVLVQHVQHYLDDFFLAGPPASSICERNLEACFFTL